MTHHPSLRSSPSAVQRAAALLSLVAGTLLAPAWAASAADDPDDDAPAAKRKAPATRTGGLRWGAESLRVEGMHLPDHPRARSTATLRADWFVTMKATPSLEWRLGLRTDADLQDGPTGDRQDGWLGWGDSWLRWRLGDARITAGMQTILWGRVDGVSLIDRVSRVDLRRFALDDLKERRLPQPALRWEHEWGDYRTDLVLLPGFQPALLPDQRSPWHPIDRAGTQVIGTAPTPALAGFFQAASLQDADRGFGGVALRVTHAGDGIDQGLTVGRTRQTLPFFRLDPVGGRILTSQPLVRFIAADAELVTGDVTWRGEIAHSRDLPMTDLSGVPFQARATELAAGMEFFPGGRDTRVNLQLLWRDVDTDNTPTIELRRYTSVSGEIESSLAKGTWKVGLRFASSLNIHDVYVSPRLSYLGWEPHEVYLAAHRFRGEQRGFGGFFRDNDALAIGFKTRF